MSKLNLGRKQYRGESGSFAQEYVDKQLGKHKNAVPLDHADESVTEEKLAAEAVTEEKIADSAVTDEKIGTRTINKPEGAGTTTGTLTNLLNTITAAVKGHILNTQNALSAKLEANNIKAGKNIALAFDGNNITISGANEDGTPPNAVYVYCDGNDDHLKLQEAIDEVEDTSIPTMIYPVGECVLKVAALGVPEVSDETICLITMKDNMTIDGQYCRMILDFTEPFDEGGYVTVFKAGNNCGLINSRITSRGENVCKHVLFTSDTPSVGKTYGTVFANNKLNGIVAKLDMQYTIYGYIYVSNGIIYNNEFKTIDTSNCSTNFISAGCDVIHNNFDGVNCGSCLIRMNGKHLMDNTFSNVAGPTDYDNLVGVTGTGTTVTGNSFIGISTYSIIMETSSQYASIKDNALINVSTAEDDAEITAIMSTGRGTVVASNRVTFATGAAAKPCIKTPLSVSGTYSVVTDNATNYVTIGEISGTGTVQDNNVATRQVTA